MSRSPDDARRGAALTEKVDVVVIGAGIIGLATAYELVRRRPGLQLVVLEKEDRLATHQSGHNSGVIHSGIYYTPGSYKASLVARSRAALLDFCAAHDIPTVLCGKVIVAASEAELPRLQALYERGRGHGLDVRLLSVPELRELEPHVAGIAALHVPEAGITDFPAVCGALAGEIKARGGDIRLGRRVRAIRERAADVVVEAGPDVLRTTRIVSCAGLHSDLLAPPPAAAEHIRILPFRGEYFDLRPVAAALVRSLVYPVPDPRFPFLGVHLTRGVHGGVHAGPNAVLALSREGYRWRDADLRHVVSVVRDPAVHMLARRYWTVGAQEVIRSLSKRAFARAVRRLLPPIALSDLVPADAGVRAQALRRDGTLVDDFAFLETARAVHVINAPSPAATACLGLGEHVAERVLSRGE